MKKTILFFLIGGLFVSVAFSQQESEAIPLDIARFVKTADHGALEKESGPPNSEAAPAPGRKRTGFEQSTEVSVDYSRQFLTNGRGTWDEATLGVIHKFSSRKVLYASYAETKRFGQRDRTAMVGFYQPLDRKWTLLVEAGASPTSNVLPKWSAMAQIERSFGNGWIGQAGYRRTEHDSAKVNIAKLGFEKYWGLNRAAYSLSINNLENTGTSASHRIQYNRYYGGELSSIGVSFATGREIENTGPGTVLQSDIYNVSVNGKHTFSKRWAIGYGYTYHKQGDIYSRRGLSLGLRYKF